MELKYFSLTDDKDTLKSKYKKYALKWHPDRNPGNEQEATKVMQEINEELRYCVERGKLKNEYGEVYTSYEFIYELLDEIKIGINKDVTGRQFLQELVLDFNNRKPPIRNGKDFVYEGAISFINVLTKYYPPPNAKSKKPT